MYCDALYLHSFENRRSLLLHNLSFEGIARKNQDIYIFLTSVTQESTNRIPKQNKTLIHQVVCNQRTG